MKESKVLIDWTESTVVSGVIERGDARGRTIGFPTANIALADDDNPRDGVYAGWAVIEGVGLYRAAVNIGRRPTFYASGGVRLAEAHLMGFEGDLYGYRAQVVLVSRLRSEMAFESVEELVRQLRFDVRQARRVLASSRPPRVSGQPGVAS